MTGSLVTRFAPSPTGYLHLGHLAHLLYLFGWARQGGAMVRLRMEDHDQGRYRPEFRDAIVEDVARFGFAPQDLGAYSVQSARFSAYEAQARALYDQGLVYGCDCSRKEIQARLPGKGELRYDGHCRDRGLAFAGSHGLRMRIPHEQVSFHDALHGAVTQVPAEQCGDVLIRDRNGWWTYQFAVVIDDLAEGINWIIRGSDLLRSTGRQILMRQILKPQVPADVSPLRLTHHPLITDDSGKKLAKRDLSTALRDHLAAGSTPEQLLGITTCSLGLQPTPAPLALQDALALIPPISIA